MLEYYMFNKPRGCITARRDERHATVMDYFPEEKRDMLFPIGRLDKDTEGLLIITNDGRLFQELMMPDRGVTKTYFFWVTGEPSAQKLSEIESGVKIYKSRDFETSPAKIELLSKSTLSDIEAYLSVSDRKLIKKRGDMTVMSGYITISEGKKHQVKRMLGYGGYRVLFLKRISIGGLSLDESLPLGEYRPLSETELRILTKSDIKKG